MKLTIPGLTLGKRQCNTGVEEEGLQVCKDRVATVWITTSLWQPVMYQCFLQLGLMVESAVMSVMKICATVSYVYSYTHT